MTQRQFLLTTTALPQIQTTKALIYCRVSDEEQVKKGHGLYSQEATCQEFADRQGLIVEKVFYEKLTGNVKDRPAMKELIAYLRKHRHEGRYVIIDDISRFARGHRAHWVLRDEVAAAGGVLISPNVQFGDSADDRLREGMLVTMAEHQRNKNAEQTFNRMRGRIMNGFWPFYTPRGYRHEHKVGEGKVLVRDEPDASIIQEGLEGFASGRFQTQAELRRYFQQHPSFAEVNNQTTHLLLTRPIYAGYVGKEEWNISLRKGRHDGLVSFETFARIQERLKEKPKAPARKDIKAEFPLRGMVACGECSRPLTACWSTSKNGVKHPYYMCFGKSCAQRGKSVRRAKIEGEFEDLLRSVVPTQKFVELAGAMFRAAWDQRFQQARSLAEACRAEALQTERQIAKLLERVVAATSDSLIGAYEKRIAELDRHKILMLERAANVASPKKPFDELFEHALDFLSSPWRLWNSGHLEHRKLVLRLTFGELLRYDRKSGFRTPKTTLPFRVLGGLSAGIKEMAEGVRPKFKFQDIS